MVFRQIRFQLRLLVVAALFLSGLNVVFGASPLDKVVEFYISSVPNPPRIDLNYQEIRSSVETGDIVIENNRAFPQWYAMIGSLIPNCRFVHAGMIVKGHVLKEIAQKMSSSGAITMRAYYRNAPPRIVDGKVKKIVSWFPYPVDPKGIYVITPEVTINTSMSKVVALNLKDYLTDPAVGYPTKHICIIRPAISDQKNVHTVASYMTYHVLKRTTYDMGFVATEKETAISRNRNGELLFDMSAQPVPLYCTELIWRALDKVGIQVPVTQVRRSIAAGLSKIPRVPRSAIDKVKADFITADSLIKSGRIIYRNAPPPGVAQALQTMVDLNFRATCQGLAEKFREIAR